MTSKRSNPVLARRMVTAALAPGRTAHDRQRELVRASLLARPNAGRATHRRWA